MTLRRISRYELIDEIWSGLAVATNNTIADVFNELYYDEEASYNEDTDDFSVRVIKFNSERE